MTLAHIGKEYTQCVYTDVSTNLTKMKILFIISTLLFFSCNQKESSIYEDTGDTVDTAHTDEDENGCGPIEQPDKESTDNDSPLTDNDSPLTDNDSPLTDNDSPLTDNDTPLTDNDSPLTDNDIELTDCPDDMVEVGSICVDRYEASREDATETDQGTATEQAYSIKGVKPWMVNPMTDDAYEKFKKACIAAGKRLCRDDEWISACEGPQKLTYSWGNEWERTTCNNVDTFCDDHCEENDIPMENCDLSENCGYNYYCFKVVPTGHFEDCTNFAGAFDINGNVWEITDTSNGYKIRGGAFNCGGPTSRLQCTYSAGWTALYAGFRCCKDR